MQVLHKKKSVCRAFRLSEDWDHRLQTAANKHNITVSSLINQIIHEYLFYKQYFEDSLIILSKKTFSNIISKISEVEMENAGKESGRTRIKEVLAQRGLEANFRNAVDIMENIFFKYGGWQRGYHHTINSQHLFALSHDFSRKWSSFLGKYYEAMFRDLGTHDISTDIEDKFITIRIPCTKNKV